MMLIISNTSLNFIRESANHLNITIHSKNGMLEMKIQSMWRTR